MRKIRNSRIKITFIAATVILLTLSVFSYMRIDTLMKTSEWVNHTNVVKFELVTFYATVKEVESAQRAYMLTHDTAYLNEFNISIAKINPQLAKLRNLTAYSAQQQKNNDKLKTLVNVRIENLRTAVEIGSVSLISPQDKLQFRTNRDALHDQIDKMVKREEQLLDSRTASLVKEYSLTPVFTIFLIIGSILVLLASYYGIISELKISNILRSDLEGRKKELLDANNSLLESNQEIVSNNDMLAKMNKELESFTYISSHDLQEPLRKIQTFITRITEKESETLSETAKNYLNRTQDAANRMQTLIRDLLAYSRLNAEEFPLDTIDLKLIVDEVKDELIEELAEKKVIVEVQSSGKINVIVSQFRQLLINLISNSIKFSDESKSSLILIENTFVDGKEFISDGLLPDLNYAKITISDNGIGFDPQYKNRIFEVFQRLHIDQKYPGTGIGLAIVKKIIDNHNGIITADGNVGKGATFTVYIPA